jgi:hypothetical protein
VDGEALPLGGLRFLVAPQPHLDLAEVGKADGLAEAVAEFPLDGQALLLAGQGLVVASLAFVDEAEVVEA